MSEAEKLKAEGNALYAKKDYASAIVKYTKAIAIDGKNAILYANRSACQRFLKRYTEALADAVTATELDPSYAKAWGRVGDVSHMLGEYTRSVAAYKKALGSLPTENLSPAEAKQKAQYEEGMKLSQSILDRPPIELSESNPRAQKVDKSAGDKAHWIVSQEMIPELVRTGNMDSVAYTLTAAYSEFSEGMRIVKATKEVPHNGGLALMGGTGALESMVNSLITNERVFHIDCENWLDLLHQQLRLEESHYHPWPTHTSPSQMIAQAPERLKKEGWRPVRMALTMNIRFWIMKGFISGVLLQQHAHKFDFFKNAVTVLRWGAKTWANVPKDDRGAIFETTFINGVRRLYLDAIMEHASSSNEDRDVMLSLLATEARELIKDLEATGPSDNHPVYVWAYHRNCLGAAHASLGYYHVQKLAHASADEAKGCYRQAADSYLKAVDGYASDDEHHTWFLHCALQDMIKSDAPASQQLAVVRRLKVALPKMKKIWWAGPGMVDKAKEQAYTADLALESVLAAVA